LALRRQGVAILLVSSKLEEVQGLSDRLAVLYEGSFIDVVDPEETTEETLGLLMAGERPGRDTAASDGAKRGSERATPTGPIEKSDGEQA